MHIDRCSAENHIHKAHCRAEEEDHHSECQRKGGHADKFKYKCKPWYFLSCFQEPYLEKSHYCGSKHTKHIGIGRIEEETEIRGDMILSVISEEIGYDYPDR